MELEGGHMSVDRSYAEKNISTRAMETDIHPGSSEHSSSYVVETC